MAKTIAEAFNAFKTNLEITDNQAELISTRRNNVVSAISKELALHPDRAVLTGSWHRHTMTRYLSEADVDVMIVLDYGENKSWYTGPGTISALNKFKEILDASFPSTEKRRDRNAISMKYPEFRLDVVPAFKSNAGYYHIPDSVRQEWVDTDPAKFNAKVSQVNNAMGGRYIPLVKMIKAWNRQVGWPIRSFHLECMMLQRYSSYTQGYTYSTMVKVFFEALPNLLRTASHDPIMSDRVDTYLDTGTTRTRDKAVAKAETAATKAVSAQFEEDTYPVASIGQWKELMGEFFPTYG